MKRSFVVAAGLVAIALGAFVVVNILTSDSGSSTTASDKQTYTTVNVEQRDLATTSDVSGTIGFGDTTTISLQDPSRVVTALPAVGTVIERGQSLAEVNGVATPFLLYGQRPVWRNFVNGMSDGADVMQLEENLVTLGVTSLTPDESFTAETKSAIKAWQEELGVTQDGVLSKSEIVFAPSSVRVAGHQATIGQSASGPALLVTGTAKLVSVSLDTSRAALAILGSPVSVVLPDGSEVSGKITYVAATATTSQGQGGQGGTTIAIQVTLDGDSTVGDNTPVTVKLSNSTATDVLAVPVKSLIALAEGGYAVERVRDGTTQLVAVTPGVFAGGWVQVTGDVAVGDQVTVPT